MKPAPGSPSSNCAISGPGSNIPADMRFNTLPLVTCHPLQSMSLHHVDEMSYQAITAMLGSSEHSDSHLDNALDASKLNTTASRQQSAEAPNHSAITQNDTPEGALSLPEAATEAGTGQGQTSDILNLPSVPDSNTAAASSHLKAAPVPDTEEALFARLTALKAKAAVPVENMNALTDRLAALKGPKVTAAELQDMHIRLEVLKGSKEPVSMSELESRLAKLKGSSPAPVGQLNQQKGTADCQLIPDFDPDVELNEEQLEALASTDNNIADNAAFQGRLTDSIMHLHQQQQQDQSAGHMPHSSVLIDAAKAKSSDLAQVLHDFDPEEEDCITEQQLQALTSMQTRGSIGVPQWAAALGLSAEDLQHNSHVKDSSQHSTDDSELSNDSSDSIEAAATGRNSRRSLARMPAMQAQLKRLLKQKELRCSKH